MNLLIRKFVELSQLISNGAVRELLRDGSEAVQSSSMIALWEKGKPHILEFWKTSSSDAHRNLVLPGTAYSVEKGFP